jgi:hypothetical protein
MTTEVLQDGTKVSDFFEEMEAIRASGAMNSYAIPQYLRENYDLSKQEALKVFTAWTKSYDTA